MRDGKDGERDIKRRVVNKRQQEGRRQCCNMWEEEEIQMSKRREVTETRMSEEQSFKCVVRDLISTKLRKIMKKYMICLLSGYRLQNVGKISGMVKSNVGMITEHVGINGRIGRNRKINTETLLDNLKEAKRTNC